MKSTQAGKTSAVDFESSFAAALARSGGENLTFCTQDPFIIVELYCNLCGFYYFTAALGDMQALKYLPKHPINVDAGLTRSATVLCSH